MKIGDKAKYFGHSVEIVKFDFTHVVLKLESGKKFWGKIINLKEL